MHHHSSYIALRVWLLAPQGGGGGDGVDGGVEAQAKEIDKRRSVGTRGEDDVKMQLQHPFHHNEVEEDVDQGNPQRNVQIILRQGPWWGQFPVVVQRNWHIEHMDVDQEKVPVELGEHVSVLLANQRINNRDQNQPEKATKACTGQYCSPSPCLQAFAHTTRRQR